MNILDLNLPKQRVANPPISRHELTRLHTSPTPDEVCAAELGALPGCVVVELHRNARGRPVCLSNTNLNDVVLGRGFWVRSGEQEP